MARHMKVIVRKPKRAMKETDFLRATMLVAGTDAVSSSFDDAND